MQGYIGLNIDRYRITERLGMGGMAVVYKAYDIRLERDVALKLIRIDEIPPSQYGRLMKRFEREAKAQASFSHPHIVPAYDYGKFEGTPYLVLAYMPGGTLKERPQGVMPVVEALNLVTPIANALAYAHRQGVLHRDVKPSNIIFSQEKIPLLTDFGIAKVLETTDATLTGTGLGVGTPEYMAPEQWQGKATEASDQYALGVVLYELLTGEKPFTAETPLAVGLKVLHDPIRQPRDLNSAISEGLEKLLFKALARSPQDRYKDMKAFIKALEVQIEKETQKPTLLTAANRSAPPTPVIDVEPGLVSETPTIDRLYTGSDKAVRPDPHPNDNYKEIVNTSIERSRKRIPAWMLWSLGFLVVIVALIGGINLFGKKKNNLLTIAAIPERPHQQLGEETATQPFTLTATPTWTATESLTYTPTSILTLTPTLTPTPSPMPVVISVDNVDALKESQNSFAGQHIAFSPDGSWIGIARKDQALIYDTASFEQVHAFDAIGVVSKIGFSPDSKWLAIASYADDNQSLWKIVLYDIETGEVNYQFEDLPRYGNFSFSHDMRFLASDYKSGQIMLWDLETGEQRYPISNTGENFVFSPVENLLATYKHSRIIRIWRVESGKIYINIEGAASEPMAFSPDGAALISGDFSGIVTFYQVNTGGVITQYYGHEGRVSSVSFSPEGDLLASCGADSKVLVWDTLTGRPIATFEPGIESYCTTVTFSPDGAGLYVSYQDGTILSWGID